MIASVFILITLLSLGLFYAGTGWNKRVLIGSLFWLLLSGMLAHVGFFEDTKARPPRFLIVPIVAISLCIFFYKNIDRQRLSFLFLLSIHALRLPVEIVLYQLFLQKQVPQIMTFHGWNFDIITGISAILLLGYMII